MKAKQQKRFYLLTVIVIAVIAAAAILFTSSQSGYHASSSAVQPSQPSSQPSYTYSNCQDSDSSYFTKGSISYLRNGVAMTDSDTCASKDVDVKDGYSSCFGINCFVKEGYCSQDSPKTEYYQCPKGCLDGACRN